MAQAMRITPSLQRERALWAQGCLQIAGVDEAGRGALAGPVVAAAAVVPVDACFAGIWTLVRDSKQLSPEERNAYAEEIKRTAFAWGIGCADAEEIDRVGIAPATRLAMTQAIGALASPPDFLLIDWVKLRHLNIPQQSFARADQESVSVAAASILAKVHRDRRMIELSNRFPAYGFERHKGYGTAEHRAAIERCGPCPVHRHTFAPIARRPNLFARPQNITLNPLDHGPRSTA